MTVDKLGASRGTTTYTEAERPDSPDFLTADEDDRTTTLAYTNCVNYQEELGGSNLSDVEDNEGVSLTGTVLEVAQFSDLENEKTESAQDQKAGGNVLSLPRPPTETKGFMDIPPEALRTNLALSLYKENAIKPEAEQEQQQESGRANWGSGREERQEVVCEQPVSAQV